MLLKLRQKFKVKQIVKTHTNIRKFTNKLSRK